MEIDDITVDIIKCMIKDWGFEYSLDCTSDEMAYMYNLFFPDEKFNPYD